MQYFERRKARIEIIPMIDIMFFLLVFFVMITLRMIPSSGIGAQLPQASTAEPLPHPKLMVVVHPDGHLEADDQPMSLDQLRARLQQLGPDTDVTVAATKDTAVQSLMHVLDACREAGATNIGLAAQPEH